MLAHRVLVTGFRPMSNGITNAALNLYRTIDRDVLQFDFLFQKRYAETLKRKYGDYHEPEIENLGGRWWIEDYSDNAMPRATRTRYQQFLAKHTEIEGVYQLAVGLQCVAPVFYARKFGKPLACVHAHTGQNVLEDPLNPRSFIANRPLIRGDDYLRLACSDNAALFHFGKKLSWEFFPNGIDLARFQLQPTLRMLSRMKLNISDETPVIAILGNIVAPKNPVFASQIFEEFIKLKPDAVFLVVGAIQDHNWAKWFVEAEPEVKKHVLIMGEQTEMDVFYNTADVLIAPSLSEGFPNALVEAQATGLPCISSTNVTSMVELTPLVRRLSLELDPATWASQALELYSTYASKRRSHTKELTQAGFDIRDTAAKLTELFVTRIERNEARA